MSRRLGRDIVERWYKNPIITLESVPFPCNTVFNAAPTKLGDEYILLMRVEDLAGRSVFALAKGHHTVVYRLYFPTILSFLISFLIGIINIV